MVQKIKNYFKIDQQQIPSYLVFLISPIVSFALLEFLNENTTQAKI